MIKSLFITAIYNLKVKDDLQDGIEFWDKIKITNNKKVIGSLITESLTESIGALEITALQNADSIFYAIDNIDINSKNDDDILCNYLGSCKIFLNDLWLVKDHCADLMMGYIEYPYIDNYSSIFQTHNTPIYTHSNIITGGFTDAIGNHHKSTEFTKVEIEEAIKIHVDDNRTLLPFSETSVKTTLLEKGMPRVTIGEMLTQTARVQNDLGLKVSHYCTALEALFMTDDKELAHKLSERVAYFLESDSVKRKELFKQTKDIYSIRSKVVHGSTINKNKYNLSELSRQADEILRRIFIKLYKTPSLDKYFRRDNNDGLEEYMTNLILGV